MFVTLLLRAMIHADIRAVSKQKGKALPRRSEQQKVIQESRLEIEYMLTLVPQSRKSSRARKDKWAGLY